MTVFSLNSNIASLKAQRRASEASDGLRQTYQRLASGLRINRASDDSAGLAVSSQLSAQSRVYGQAVRNINDAASLLNVAEGAAGELVTILERMKELAGQSANGSLSLTQRRSLDAEAYSLQKEFNRITATTRFNGRSLIEGNFGKLNIQAGFGGNGLLSFNLGTSLEYNAGNGSFKTASFLGSYQESNAPLAVGDFNNDGKDDAFLSSESGSQSRLLLSNGDGTFSVVAVATNLSADTDVRVGDVNNDGNLDVVSTSTVLLGNGDGTFKSGLALSSSNQQIRLADINGDGKLDLLGLKVGAGLNIQFGNGNGTFTGTTGIFSTATDFEIGDFNGDGLVDIVGVTGGNTLQFYQGSGSGSLVTGATTVVGVGLTLHDVGDVNHDGVSDLLLGGAGGTSVYVGSASGAFSLSSNVGSQSIAMFGDVNRDGQLDVIGDDGALNTYLGNGNGTFGSVIVSVHEGLGVGLESMALLDVDGDGNLEFLYSEPVLGDMTLQFANTVKQTTFERLNLASRDGALEALDTIEEALTRVKNELGAIGANQSRLSATLEVVQATELNYKSAFGRIVDVDVAQETARLTAQQIRQQSATAVLAQANQLPALTLSLLQP